MFSALRQFALRTVSSSSSTGRSRMGSNCVSVALVVDSSWPCKSTNTDSWSLRIPPARRIASSGSMVPLVSISRMSLSRSVRCSTRALSTLYVTLRTGLNEASSCSRPITSSALDLQRHRQFTGLGQIRDHEIRVQNLDIVVAGNIAGRHGARTLLVQAHLGDVAGVHADGHRFEVQQNVDDVLLDTLDGGVLVEHTFDFDFSNGGARQRGQQYAAQGIAQRVTKAAFERFDHDTRMARRHGLYFDDPRLQKLIDRSLHGY